MNTFDTCDTCGLYYVTKDRSILPDHNKVYVPQVWGALEGLFGGVASPLGTVDKTGKCYICDEVKPLRHWFAA